MDILIMAAYVAVIVCVGMATSRHRDMDSDFFLASRSMHRLPIGLSITLTAIGYSGTGPCILIIIFQENILFVSLLPLEPLPGVSLSIFA